MTAPVAGSLAGQVAAVTGGGSGIGLAAATAISAAGGSVLLAGRTTERLTKAAATLPGPVQTLAVDVGDPAAGQQLIDAAVAAFGSLDIVIANAGVYLPGDLVDTDPAAAARLIDTNVSGVISTVQAAVKHFTAKGNGDILVTGSVSGQQAISWEAGVLGVQARGASAGPRCPPPAGRHRRADRLGGARRGPQRPVARYRRHSPGCRDRCRARDQQRGRRRRDDVHLDQTTARRDQGPGDRAGQSGDLKPTLWARTDPRVPF